MKKLIFISLLLTTTAFYHCGSDDDTDGVSQNFTTKTTGNFAIEKGDSDINGNCDIGETFEGPAPSEPSTVDGSPNDTDGDGFNNDEDNIPDVCTKMVVTSRGISSARIILNDEEIYSPNDFKNKDFKESRYVNLNDGDNNIQIRLAGSPGDQINVRFYNCSEDPVELVFETTVTRTAGAPNVN